MPNKVGFVSFIKKKQTHNLIDPLKKHWLLIKVAIRPVAFSFITNKQSHSLARARYD